MTVPPLTWLYVPADRPDRVEKALTSEAHAVIVDLEDAVAPTAKEAARSYLAELLDRPRGKRVHVRINGVGSSLAEADLAIVAGLAGVDAITIPKVESPEDVETVVEHVPAAEVHCLIESARGVEAAYAIATSTPQIAGISLGESDLRSELGALEPGLDWARSRIVNAAVAAGLPRPPQSVYPHVGDDEGLARSCARGRELGHLGRAAIHPRQLPIILDAYLPTEEESQRARETIERLQEAAASTLAAGEFVDAAMLGAAEQIAAIADRYGTRGR